MKAFIRLEHIVANGVGWAFEQGWHWLRSELVPLVRSASETPSTTNQRHLLGEAHYLLGDLFDLCYAPKAALREYRRCLRMIPNHAAAWREMGCRFAEIGEGEKARRAWRNSANLNPDDPLVAIELECGVFGEDSGKPIYDINDPCWRAAEQLVKGWTKGALETLKRRRKGRARMWRINAYGAAYNSNGVITEWRNQVSSGRRISIWGVDWFFLPRDVSNSPTFWELLRTCHDRIDAENFQIHENLISAVLLSIAPSRRQEAMSKAQNQFIQSMIDFHIARTTRDLFLATRLAKLYPTWSEVVNLAISLKRPIRGRRTIERILKAPG